MDKTGGHRAIKQADLRGQRLHDFTYTWDLKKSNPQSQRAKAGYDMVEVDRCCSEGTTLESQDE